MLSINTFQKRLENGRSRHPHARRHPGAGTHPTGRRHPTSQTGDMSSHQVTAPLRPRVPRSHRSHPEWAAEIQQRIASLAATPWGGSASSCSRDSPIKPATWSSSPPAPPAPTTRTGVGTEHLLVGILDAGGPGTAALTSWGVTAPALDSKLQGTGGLHPRRRAHPEHRQKRRRSPRAASARPPCSGTRKSAPTTSSWPCSTTPPPPALTNSIVPHPNPADAARNLDITERVHAAVAPTTGVQRLRLSCPA